MQIVWKAREQRAPKKPQLYVHVQGKHNNQPLICLFDCFLVLRFVPEYL